MKWKELKLSKDIQETLDERGERYGDFKNHADISQEIQTAIGKGFMLRGDGITFNDIPAYQLEALTMIAHKIGRIVNGDISYDDSWRDIAGYATLVVNELEKSQDFDRDESPKEKENATSVQENRKQISVQ